MLKLQINCSLKDKIKKKKMLGWLKKHYSQIAQKNWYSCELNDQSMLRPCSKQVKQQLKEQKKSRLEKVIHELGLVQGKDENGKIVLKNNIPIRKEITLKETNKLIKKLNTNKPSSFAYMVNQSKLQQRKVQTKENEKDQGRVKVQVVKKSRPFHEL